MNKNVYICNYGAQYMKGHVVLYFFLASLVKTCYGFS